MDKKKPMKLDIKKFAILKNGIRIEGQKSTQTSQRSKKWYPSVIRKLKINPKAFAIPILTMAIYLAYVITVKIGMANALGFIFNFLITLGYHFFDL